MKLHTNFDYPPIPYRDFDWSCLDEDAYDPCYDEDCPCRRSAGNIVGRGPSEDAAISDFVSQILSHYDVDLNAVQGGNTNGPQ